LRLTASEALFCQPRCDCLPLQALRASARPGSRCRQVASDLVSNFDDGVFLVELAPLSDPDLLLDTISRSLNLSREATQSIEDALFEYLSERRLLLVLDNFEHLL